MGFDESGKESGIGFSRIQPRSFKDRVPCKILGCARLQSLTQQTWLVACPMFCRTRSCSRSWTIAASITTTNGAGDGARKASPFLLRSQPPSPPDCLPGVRDGALGSYPLSALDKAEC